ncbi:hypothetical protein BSKO_12410 [Bryopsis sp. KO-2023]|nr:hypothetical protein BSKO_12410 [Bryopsis sp. KO-2023]
MSSSMLNCRNVVCAQPRAFPAGVSAQRLSVGRVPEARRAPQPLRALDIDFSDPDTLQGLIGGVVGLGLGLGIPVFLISRDDRDDERVAEIREMNKATKASTGEYMSQDEIEEMRPRRWTDRRDFQDDD